MATFIIRKIKLCLDWDKDDQANINYFVRGWYVQNDDSKADGEEEGHIRTPTLQLTRNQFRNLTGQDMEDAALLELSNVLQTVGTGAGSHTVLDEL